MKKSQEMIDRMLENAEVFLAEGKADRAFSTYVEIIRMCPDFTAQYNLGVLFAQGRGTGQNFLEAAYWFEQAAREGDEEAEKLCRRCTVEFLQQKTAAGSARELFEAMAHFSFYVWPEKDVRITANKQIFSVAAWHFKREEYADAAKLFRAAAEFGGDGMSQKYLGVLYNAGAGVEKNDLAALYWFDRAADQRIAPAEKDRDGILNAYRSSLSPAEFYEQMNLLGEYCAFGTEDIPRDATKAERWRQAAV